LHNKDSQEFTGFEFDTKGGALPHRLEKQMKRQRERRAESCSPSEGEETSAGTGRRRIAAEERWSPARGLIARKPGAVAGQGRRNEPGLGLGQRRFFKNGVWAYRTVYSVCPVHTGQRTVAVR
jgi:hypothetical protein